MGGLFRMVLWLAQWVSPAWAWRLSGVMAWLMDKLGSSAMHITDINLQLCFPELSDTERAALRHRSLRHMALLFFEFAQIAHWPTDKLMGRVKEFQGKELLDAATAKGEPVLLLVPHFGNWEMLSACLGSQYGFAALYDPPKIKSLESAIVDGRQRFTGEMYAIGTGGIRSLLKAMRQGTPVLVLPDQVPDRSAGVYAPFFNHPALTMTLSHRLARKSQHIFIAAVERLDVGDLGYRFRIEPLQEDVADMDPEQFATVLNSAIEKLVRRAPEQYQWEYKRFKRPPGTYHTNVYRRQ
jgi:KDO2-lipid IV(A) lauroyltransferase